MKKTITLIVWITCCMAAYAQTKSKWNIAASINPTFSYSINTSSSNQPVQGSNLTYQQYNDSVRSHESYRFNFGFTAWFNYSLNQKWDLQAGLGYSDIGFQRQQRDIKFKDRLYPGIGNGTLMEFSNNVKNIDYNYHYQYLHIPVLFNHRMGKSHDYKFIFSYSLGATLDVLLKHRMTASLDNFYVDNENHFSFDSTGYGARPIALSLTAGARVDYKIDKKLTLMVQPLIGIYPVSVAPGPINVYPFYFMINTGLIFEVAR